MELAALAGDISRSASDVIALGAAFPEDLDIRHRTGVTLVAHGFFDEAEAQFRAALAIRPRFCFSELELGNICLRRGALDDAAHWFDVAIASEPCFALAHVAAGKLAMSRGQHLRALLYLESANIFWSASQEVLSDYVEMLVYHNRRYQAASAFVHASTLRKLDLGEARRLMSLLAETGRYAEVLAIYTSLAIRDGHGGDQVVVAIQAHAKLALSFSKDNVIMEAAAQEKSPAWLNSPAVHDNIRRAIESRAPFSVVRLYDGEARFVVATAAPAPQRLLDTERFVIGDEVWRNWFGHSIADIPQSQLAALHASLLRAIGNADILGVPTAERLIADSYHFGYLAFLARRLADDGIRAASASVSDAFLSMNLHRDDRFYARLLSGLDWIGVISPHHGLASSLAAHLGIPHALDFVIPGERQLPRHILATTLQSHFPDRFHELMSTLELPHQGAVVLVAAGLLGKIYCEKIKSLGGIAIDIGSVADGWMGFNTRVGQLDDTAFWRLPSLPP